MKEKNEPEQDFSIVYIYDEDCYGTVVSHGAYASLVNYFKNGIEHQVSMLNEDFEVVEEIGIGYIQEEDL